MLLLGNSVPIFEFLRNIFCVFDLAHFDKVMKSLFLFDDMLFGHEKGIFISVNTFHGINENHQKIIHILFLFYDQVDHSVLKLESNALPRVEGNVQGIVLLGSDGVHVLSEHPEAS